MDESVEELEARYARERLRGRIKENLILGGFALATAVIMVFQLDLQFLVVRPFALRFGRPAKAIVSSRYHLDGRRTSGDYLEFNYAYSKDYAPRVAMKVGEKLYAAIRENDQVAIHYLPHCPSCIALDDDRGDSFTQGMAILVMFGFVVVLGGIAGLMNLAHELYLRWRRRSPAP